MTGEQPQRGHRLSGAGLPVGIEALRTLVEKQVARVIDGSRAVGERMGEQGAGEGFDATGSPNRVSAMAGTSCIASMRRTR